MDKSINDRLLDVIGSWTDEVFVPFVQSETDNGYYKGDDKNRIGQYVSCPFYVGLNDEYIANSENKTRIMVIGQEARHFGSWTRDKDNVSYMPSCSQAWSIEYLNKQIDKNFKSRFNVNYNKSRFWHLFRTLNKNNFVVCWNNVDKVYFGKDEEYKGTLTYEAERALSKRYGKENKSLLQREIEIANPDVLLFVTGPSYAISMETAFDVKEQLAGKLIKSDGICDITDVIGVGKRALWTYHPANRQRIDVAKSFLQTYDDRH